MSAYGVHVFVRLGFMYVYVCLVCASMHVCVRTPACFCVCAHRHACVCASFMGARAVQPSVLRDKQNAMGIKKNTIYKINIFKIIHAHVMCART